jgi:hypothetical protein
MTYQARFIWKFAVVAATLAAPFARAAEAPNVTEAVATLAEAPGLGEPGELVSLTVESASYGAMRGSDARRQLVVTGKHSSGQLRDWTRKVTFESMPQGVVTTSETGLVTPLSDGDATIVARSPEGIESKIAMNVERFGKTLPVNFPNQIAPILTKHGCNSGGCHGKQDGQNGFRLSLLGFYPGDDHEFLVKEGRGRRMFAASPQNSLLIQKATNTVPHGGGERIQVGSYEHRLMTRWMLQGMPYGDPDAPRVARLEVVPERRTMDRESEQQISVFAHYTDGAVEDVSPIAQYESNDTEMAEVTSSGIVTTLDLMGEVAVMIRYQGQVGVFRASIPLGLKLENIPPVKNFIDELVFKKLEVLGIPVSPLCDDAAFVRRVTLDVCGRLPTGEEAEQFIASKDTSKRDKLIDQLLETPEYADYFANKWASVLRNKGRDANDARGTYAFHDWIRSSFITNKPYDQFVREIVAATGDVERHPPVVWYRSVRTRDQQVEDVSQLFLGLRIQCARCHHHPFEKWSQEDYYGFAAFFSRVKRKAALGGVRNEERITHQPGEAQAQNPRTGEQLKPAGLGSPPLTIQTHSDPRAALADWMTDPENPFFSRALVNRYWKHFFSRGIVEPEDDMRVTNPPSNPALIAGLSDHFVKSGYDLRDLVRTICRSSAYQLTSDPHPHNIRDKQNFSRYYPRRLTAEVLSDAIGQATGVTTTFGGLPASTRAVQLPDANIKNYFLTVFGKPQGESACECERSQEASLAQSLYLLNSSEVQGKLTAKEGRTARLASYKEKSSEEKIRELYLSLYAREPEAEDLRIAMKHLKKVENQQQAFEDILWALINTKEFLFNH